jgi:D-alanine-D-alanine ligase
MDIGIAFDLRSDFAVDEGAPLDRLEEYDSRETVDAIAHALETLGHRVRLLGGGRRFVEAVLREPPELVFNIAEGWGTRSREAHVPAVCEMLGIAFTHSDPLTLALTLDKPLTKRVVASHAIPTPAFAVVQSEEDLARVELSFPVIVKPAWEGSSMGIRRSSRVADATALRDETLRLLADYRQPVLVERFLPGAEMTVGITGNADAAEIVGVMEIEPRRVPRERFVYGLEAKREYAAEVAYHVPPRSVSAIVVARAGEVALAAFRALGCRDVARVDLRCDEHDDPHFLEVNPLPGLSPATSDLVIQARSCGRSFEDLIGRIVEAALKRQGLR